MKKHPVSSGVLMRGSPLATAFDAVACPIFVVEVASDGRFEFSFLNTEHEQLSGLVSEDIAGLAPEDFLPSRLAAQLNGNYQACVDKRSRHTYEEVLQLPSGEKWWLTTLVPVFDAEDRVCRIVATASDITAQKQALEEAARHYGELDRQLQEYLTFSAAAAHDLRSPLVHLDSLLQLTLLNFQDLGDGKTELLENSRAVVAKSSRYLSDVLAYCRRDRYSLASRHQLDFGHLCGDLAAILDPNERHEISFDDVLLSTDGTVVQIAVRNLLDNAIKHNPDRQLCIAISVRQESADMLTLKVTDDGNGLPPLQGAGAIASDSGFGLGVVRDLLASRGGTLRLDEACAGGVEATFTIAGRLERDAARRISA